MNKKQWNTLSEYVERFYEQVHRVATSVDAIADALEEHNKIERERDNQTELERERRELGK